jgi:hypothetical protein
MRIGAIDFWRGLILLMIMVDHVPGNWLEGFTPRNYGLSDSAEAFVFLSGLSVGAAYYNRSITGGLRPIARACAARSFYIYRIHIALTLAALAIFGAAYWMSGLPDLIEAHGRGFVFDEPRQALAGVMAMTHQLGYFNILPMYVVLMLFSPLILALAQASVWRALGVSSGVYVVVRVTGFNLPNWPQPGGWFFDPLAWQLIFTLGVCTAIKWREAPLPRSAPAQAAAMAIVIGGALVVSDGAGLTPGLRDWTFVYVDAHKQQLGLGRLVYFIALAYALSQSSWLRRAAESAAAEEMRRLGRHSLEVFGFSSLLAAVGQAFLPLAGIHGSPALVKSLTLMYTLASLTALFILARTIEWDGNHSGARRWAAVGKICDESRGLARSLRLAFTRQTELLLNR